jgi:hypothetical protein
MGQHGLWEDRLSELADYRKITGTAMFLKIQRKNIKLATWVSQNQSINTGSKKGRTSPLPLRIQELEDWVWWKPSYPPGERDTKERYLDVDATRVRGGPWRQHQSMCKQQHSLKDFSGRNP